MSDPVVVKKEELKDDAVVSAETLAIPWIAEYIAGLYRYAVVIGAVIAVVVLIIGGFMYSTSAGRAGQVKKANDLMIGSMTGLVLLLGTYLFLGIINKDLTNLRAIEIEKVKRIDLPDYEFHEECKAISDYPPHVLRNTAQGKRPADYTLTETEYGDRISHFKLIASGGSATNRYRAKMLQKPAANAFLKWMVDYTALGHTKPAVNSAYRSSRKQSCLHSNLPEGIAAESCKSNHELGLAVDLNVSTLTTEEFKDLLKTGIPNGFLNFHNWTADTVPTADDNGVPKWKKSVERWHFDFKSSGTILKNHCFLNPACCG